MIKEVKTKTLEDIVKGCINKNKSDQEAFFNMFAGRFMAVCQRVGPNNHIANDILQDSFIKIFRSMSSLNSYDEVAVCAWCKRIITNQAIDFYRKEKRHNNNFDIGDVPQKWHKGRNVGSVNEVGVESDEDSYMEIKNIPPAKIISAIQGLPPRYKLVFNMFIIDGLTHEEIGGVLNITEGTSKSNLSKAKLRLREELTLCN